MEKVNIDRIAIVESLYDTDDLEYNNYRFEFKIDNPKIIVVVNLKCYLEYHETFVGIQISDILYGVTMSKFLEATTYDRLESIVYELIGRYFGIYEGSKPKDLEYFNFANSEDKIILENLLKAD